MKKIMGLIVIAIMVMLPMSVKAAGSFIVNCGKGDGVADLNVTWTKEGLEGTAQCTLKYKVESGSFDRLKVTMRPTDEKIVSLVGINKKWNLTSDSQVNGSGVKVFTFESSTPANAGETVELGTVMLKVMKGKLTDNCTVSFEPELGTKVTITESNVCKVVNGKYYGKSGNVVTEEQYNKECAGNPQTGNFVPYAYIVGGTLIAAVVFIVSRKNNKLYKI